jgi:erythromycin esterase-like protein
MSKHGHHENAAPEAGAVNWDPPAKRDLVERALSDGITDPAKIIEWAANYDVAMTVEEVLRLKAELQK